MKRQKEELTIIQKMYDLIVWFVPISNLHRSTRHLGAHASPACNGAKRRN